MNEQQYADRIATERRRGRAYVTLVALVARHDLGMDRHGWPTLRPTQPLMPALRVVR